MIDGADGYNVFSNEYLVKRCVKEHRCGECGRTIRVGEPYMYHSWLYDGCFDVSKTCSHCQVACDWLSANCSGYLVCNVLEDIQEHVDEYRRDKPDCMGRLMVLLIGMRHKWVVRRGPRKGELMRLPQLPAALEPAAKMAA